MNATAWRIEEPGPIERHPLKRATIELARPGPGQVLLRVLACGVCRTDLHEAEGEVALPRLPVVPGHQVVGEVEEAGPGSALTAGARVGVGWLHEACGRCPFCARGEENLCDAPLFTGLHVDGGYASLLSAASAYCLPLPDSLGESAAAAPLLCAGIIGYRALRVAGVVAGETVGLYGFGGSAHIALQVLLHWRCRVFVFTRGSSRQALARRLGAAGAASPGEAPPQPLDRAISFAPAGELVPLMLGALRKGGVAALAGIHVDRIPELPYRLLFGERSLRTVTAATRRDGQELLELAARIPIRAQASTFPLEEANRALRELKAGAYAGSAVLVP